MRALLASACAVALLTGPAPLAPAVAQEAASAVQDLVLDNVSLAFGDTLVTAPKVTVSGTRLSRDDLLAIFKADTKDAKDPVKDLWPARLQRLDAGSLTMPVLRVERRDGERRQVVTYRDVAARTIRAGAHQRTDRGRRDAHRRGCAAGGQRQLRPHPRRGGRSHRAGAPLQRSR
jgi:hypothetical protein